jgi:hypothetical protein
MGHVESEDSFKNFPEKGSDQSCDQGSFCINGDLRDEFIYGEEDKEGESEWNKILKEEVVDQRYYVRIDIVGNERTFVDRAVYGCPYCGDRKGSQHDYPHHKHDQVLDQAVVKKGFLEVGFEYKVNGINKIREQKARCNKGSDQPEKAKVRYIPGYILDSVEKIRIELSEEFLRENVEALEYEF